MNPYTKFANFILEPYNSLDYLRRAKAKYLFIIGLILLVLMHIGSLGILFLVPENFPIVFRNLSVMVIGIALSIYFLRKGNYPSASIIFLITANLGVIVGMITRVYENPLQSMSTYFFFGFSGLGLCMLFTGVRMLSLVSLMYVAALTYNYIVGLPMIPVELHKTYKLNYFDALFGLALLYSVGVLTIRIFRKNYRIVKHQKLQSEKQNYFIKNILRENSRNVMDVSNRLSDSVVRVSQEASQQAGSSEEIVASVEELEAGMHSIFLRAKEQEEQMVISKNKTKELSETMKNVSTETSRILNEINQMMERYKSAEQNVLMMRESIHSIHSSSNEMKGILKIITDISAKVNMLALNAAIEAARAGEAGRGFSVVADEISKLADKTSNSVKGIDQLIQKNNDEIESGYKQVDSAISDSGKVKEGIQSIRKLLTYLNELTQEQSKSNLELEQDSKIVLHLSREIVESTDESKVQTKSISESMETISRITSNFIYAIEEVNDFSKTLQILAQDLNQKIESQE